MRHLCAYALLGGWEMEMNKKICVYFKKHRVRQRDGYCYDCGAYTGWKNEETETSKDEKD